MAPVTKIVQLYDNQVDVKFYVKKHQYYRKFNVPVLVIPSQDKDIPPASIECPGGELDQWIKVPSTTTVTRGALDKPELNNWLVDSAIKEMASCLEAGDTIEEASAKAKGYRFRIMRKGGAVGSAVHDWASQFILSRMDDSFAGPSPEQEKEITNAILGFLQWYEEEVKEPLQTEFIVYNPELDIAGTKDFVFANKNDEIVSVDFKTGNRIYPADVMQLAFYRHTYGLQEGQMPDKSIILHLNKTKPKATPYDNLDHEANLIAFECAKYLTNWSDSLNI